MKSPASIRTSTRPPSSLHTASVNNEMGLRGLINATLALHLRTITTSLLVFSLLAPSIRAGEQERFSFERTLMGTRFQIICYTTDRAAAERAAAAAFQIAEEVNAVASDYLPHSELSMLTAHPANTPVTLSARLYELLSHSRQIAETTHGTFDPTLGPLTKLWREARNHGRLPEPDNLQSARTHTGWQYFTLDPETRSITLLRENMAFDLGGVAKGHAADWMIESLGKAGISRAMIVAGGDVRVGDAPPGREGWRVALQTFDLARSEEILVLSNAAVSTSGNLHQSIEIDGVKYSHILDPTTGLGLTRRIAASVIADEAKLSDPLATAACVTGPDGLRAMRELPGVREVKIFVPL